jgi:hypothetical protein
MTLGLVTRSDAMTGETTSRLRWIYQVAYHAGYAILSANIGDHRRARTP